MSINARLTQLARDPRIPTPPAVALQVLQKASRPDCSLAELAKIIGHDPGLCVKILGLVNSALFGLPLAVRNVDRALQLLGLRRVRSLVLALSMPSMARHAPGEDLMQPFWKASLAGALTARELAVKRGFSEPDNEFVAGLLRDLGILAFLQVCPDEYAKVLSQPGPILARQQCQIEETVLGVSHPEVSAFLLRQWHLPDEMTEAIRWHHAPEQAKELGAEMFDRARALHFASCISALDLAPGDQELRESVLKQAKDSFGMSEGQFLAFLGPLAQQTADLAGILAVNLGPLESFADVVRRSSDELTALALESSLDNLRLSAEKVRAEEGRAEAEAALQKTAEQLRQTQKLEAIGRLAGGVAHDFNNLLVVINGYSEFALMSLPADNPARAMIVEIKKSGERAAALTRQLLAFSRKQILTPVMLDLNEVITDMVKMLRRLIGEDIELVINLSPVMRSIQADPSQLEQVILNLVVNARDAMEQGGKLTIETSSVNLTAKDVQSWPERKPGSFVRLLVRDTGVGMDEHVLAHLFEPFFTTKGPGRGTGLGLATVYGVVRQSGGHITVESTPGQGSTFIVYWPHGANTMVQAASAPMKHDLERGSETILLVEDEASVRELTSRVLRLYGYTVLEARDSEEAVKLAASHPRTIELIISDVVLPRMNGPQLVQRLQATRPALKVLYMTGYLGNELAHHGLPDHGVAVLQKPFSQTVFAAKVREVLSGARPIQSPSSPLGAPA